MTSSKSSMAELKRFLDYAKFRLRNKH